MKLPPHTCSPSHMGAAQNLAGQARCLCLSLGGCKSGRNRAGNVTNGQVRRYLLGSGGLLSQETQLLLPLLSDLGDDGVEEAELLALLVHLVVGVFEHHLEAVVSQNGGQSLRFCKVEIRVKT